jgi:metal-responsive CopG/Arc/MetJ family transcriptional regulator
MPRGGYREGAGRKKEYTEPVRKILLGLPESVLQQLDEFAAHRGLSRPKAIAALLKLSQRREHKEMLQELKSLHLELKKNSD